MRGLGRYTKINASSGENLDFRLGCLYYASGAMLNIMCCHAVPCRQSGRCHFPLSWHRRFHSETFASTESQGLGFAMCYLRPRQNPRRKQEGSLAKQSAGSGRTVIVFIYLFIFHDSFLVEFLGLTSDGTLTLTHGRISIRYNCQRHSTHRS